MACPCRRELTTASLRDRPAPARICVPAACAVTAYGTRRLRYYVRSVELHAEPGRQVVGTYSSGIRTTSMGRILGWIVPAMALAGAAVTTLWMAGAIYYDVCGGRKWGRLLALSWVVGVIALFAAWRPVWQPFGQ